MSRVRATSSWLAIAMLATALWPTAAWAVTKPLNAVSFSDNSKGVIAGSPNGIDGVLSWTSNGGDSWHATVEPGRNMVGVRASSGGTAVTAIAGEPFDGIYKSADSGRSWTAETPLFNRTTALWGMAYLSGSRRAVVGEFHSGNHLAVIASSVGGALWNTDFMGPYHPGPTPEDPPLTTNAVLTAIDAVPGGAVAWAVGYDYTTTTVSGPYDPLIYKWTNSGSTWITETPLPAAGAYITCVAAAGADTAFAVRAPKALLRTVDGSPWAPAPSLPPTLGISTINAIDAYDADHVLVVGNGGRIAWTENASTANPTWTMNAETAPNELLGAQMIDANNWIVVGDNETIWRTANGGDTWTGSKSVAAPTVAITTDGANLGNSADVLIEGTSSDGAGIGVAKVEIRIQRADRKYWNGSAWVVADTWIAANPETSNNWDGWSKSVSLPGVESALTVWARATDGLGLPSTNVPSIGAASPSAIALQQTSITVAYHGIATIKGVLTSAGSPVGSAIVRLNPAQSPYAPTTTTDANGNFTFLRAPSTRTTYTLSFAADATHKATSAQVTVIPKVQLNRPVVPKTTIRSTRYFKAYGDMYPKHGSGGRITFIFQRYQKVGTKYAWVTKKTVSAPAVTVQSWSRATVSVKLPVGVSWRVQTKHADTGHATSYSPWKSFRVR